MIFKKKQKKPLSFFLVAIPHEQQQQAWLHYVLWVN